MLFRKDPLIYLVCMALITPLGLFAQQQNTEEEAQETEIIIIEERIDHNGNKTVNKTVRKGNFTDEEIDRIVEEESGIGQNADKALDYINEEKRGYLGVQITNIEGDQGVQITDIVEGSPANIAGLQAHDVIKAVEGETVNNVEELVALVGDIGAGEDVEITYARDGAPGSATATLARRSDYEKSYKIMNEEIFEHETDARPKRKLGVYLGHSEQGVKVTDIAGSGIAEKAGIEAGDIITAFNGKAVTTSDELVDAIQSAASGEQIAVTYLRDGEQHTKTVEFDF